MRCDVEFFNWECDVGLDEEEDKYDVHDGLEEDDHDANTTALGVGVNQDLQPANLMEEEAVEMAITQSDLDHLTQWDGLAIQLRASAHAQRRRASPPATPPAPIPQPTPQQPLHWPWPVFINLIDDDNK
jgi:hypothetical protein